MSDAATEIAGERGAARARLADLRARAAVRVATMSIAPEPPEEVAEREADAMPAWLREAQFRTAAWRD